MTAGLASLMLALSAAQASSGAADQVPINSFKPAPDQPACQGSKGYADAFEGRRTFLWRPQWLRAIQADEQARATAVQAADKALRSSLYSVTDKPKPAPGATAHDYASIGPYWWPDPAKKSGLPYIRRDGQVNPQRNGPEFDKDRLRRFSNDAKDLALAYYVTGEEKYAEQAARMLRTWFITPATRMNPSFNFAQGIPGKVNGRAEGIIEASHLSTIIEAIGLLRPSTALSKAEHQAIEQWYRDFATWMATSENGTTEMRKGNNHGIFFDYYLAHFALYARLENVTENIVTAFPQHRLARQMDRRGRFIAELKRTRSWHYSHYVVEGTTKLATIAECVDLDLWTYELPDGRGIPTARSFLAKYWDGEMEWPFQDIDHRKANSSPKISKTVKAVQILVGYSNRSSASQERETVRFLP
ncbi:alginate lyase family protein [Parasphingorhabdus cellanae]|uniref:Alginate lyase family protein n=1 Tax=Parasphingorhabdus cellanae TaxID=2806553 RepID=A0ABX7T7P3_9SPHN|nr:alginate lyase family protein [Parasphingorhabdus cellanae]QTD57624.1 alginate lyase family protein [Parasphingorhabdus cellanae]